MSRHNKANKNNYSQAGRLSQDDMARERVDQGEMSHSKSKENITGKVRSGEQGSNRPRSEREESE